MVATGNPGKVVEMRRILSDSKVLMALPSEEGISWSSPEETGTTYQENAWIKASSLGELCGLPAIGEDAGLEVEALKGAPGLYSARYAETTEARNTKLLLELSEYPNETERKARFVCSLALWLPGESPQYFSGELKGRIALAPSGNLGFGYDPLFIPEGEEQTLAALGADFKNKSSHRAKALRSLVANLPLEVLNCLREY